MRSVTLRIIIRVQFNRKQRFPASTLQKVMMACFMCILETHAAILRNPADMILFKCKDATKLASTCAAASLDREGYRGCFIHQFSLTKLLSFPVSLLLSDWSIARRAFIHFSPRLLLTIQILKIRRRRLSHQFSTAARDPQLTFR